MHAPFQLATFDGPPSSPSPHHLSHAAHARLNEPEHDLPAIQPNQPSVDAALPTSDANEILVSTRPLPLASQLARAHEVAQRDEHSSTTCECANGRVRHG